MIQLTEATPIDGYVYELKTKHGSKFYQNAEDAFHAKSKIQKQTDEFGIKIIRHDLVFTSKDVAYSERMSLEAHNQMRDLSFLVDEVYKPNKPRKSRTFSYTKLVWCVIWITLVCELALLIYKSLS